MQLDRHIQLLDCPGVVMETGTPTAAAPLRGALDPQRLRDPLGPAAAILRRCPPQQVGGGRGDTPNLGGGGSSGLSPWRLGVLGIPFWGLRLVTMATRGVMTPPWGLRPVAMTTSGVGDLPWGA